MAEAAISTNNGSLSPLQIRAFSVALEEMGFIGARDGFQQWAHTFQGRRDMFKVLGYKRRLRYRDYKQRYDRDSIAGRIVDVPAKYTWRSPPTLTEGGSSDTPFIKAFDSLVKRQRLWTRFEKVDKISGIGRYAILLIGARKGSADLSTKMPKLSGPEDIAYLSVFSEGNAKIVSLENDPRSDRFGQPAFYQVDLTRGMSNAGTIPAAGGVGLSNQRVHASRCLHVAECDDEDDVLGVPRLRRVWNLLDDLFKCVGASGESFWRAADRGMQIDVDKDMNWNPKDKADLEAQIEEYVNDFRRIFRTRGVKMNVLGSEGINPRGVFAVISSLVVGATGIPLRVLFGPERGQFSLPEERAGFLQLITDRQIGHASPNILGRFNQMMIDCGGFPPLKDEEKGYEEDWPDLLLPSELEQSQAALNYANAARAFAQQQSYGQPVVDRTESRKFFPGLDPDKPAEKLPPPPNPKKTGVADANAQGT